MKVSYSEIYNEEYYRTSCGELPYTDKAWIPFYEKVADNIVNSIKPKTVLDVGCAMGYLVAALRDRGVEAYGIDVSEYAISKVREDISEYCKVNSALNSLPKEFPTKYDLLVTIEVIEHLYEEDSVLFLDKITNYSDDIIFSSTPDDIWETTHYNVQQPEYWIKRFASRKFFRDNGYDCSYISKQALRFRKRSITIDNLIEDYERERRFTLKSNESTLIQLHQTETELKELAKNHNNLNKDYATTIQKNDELELQIKELAQNYNDVNKEYATAIQKKDELEQQIKKLAQSHNNLKKEYAIGIQKNSELEQKIKELNRECESLKLDIDNKILVIEKQKMVINEEKQNNIKIDHVVKTLHDDIKSYKAEITVYEANLRSKDADIRSLKENYEQFTTEMTRLKGSRCYKFAIHLYNIKELFVPRGSVRFTTLKLIYRLPLYSRKGYVKKAFKYLRLHGIKGFMRNIYAVVNGDLNKLEQCLNNPVVNNYCDEPSAKIIVTPVLSSNSKIIKHEEAVDIIICVHNAFEDVKRCINSVFEYTSNPYNIIIVDDGSADETKNYLKELKESCANVKLIRNETGNGYTIAANMGLRESTAEFRVLLNSDTIVTPNWLDKLIRCANSDEEIGIVGPLSNTASWQSVPSLFEDSGDWCHNRLPSDISIEDMGNLVEKYIIQTNMQVPLLNGFCMMIRKNVIDKIGYLDEENFGKGFGEEDDFNLRAFKAGIKLAISTDTYIYHAQSKSYSDSKRLELCKNSGKKVREKHGDQLLDQALHWMKDNYLLDGIRSRIKVMFEREKLIKLAKDKWEGKRILFILPVADAGGGANVIIQEANVMRNMGVDVWLYNRYDLKEYFTNSYPFLDIPVLYGEDNEGFCNYVDSFDVICATLYKGISWCSGISNSKKSTLKIAYYIQDFEPDFFENGSEDYYEALESYTKIKDIVPVTKTFWNKNKVKDETGLECHVIGPSVDIDLFRPYKILNTGEKIRVVAMIRPESPRRAAMLTMQVLSSIYNKNKNKLEIIIFGSDPKKSRIDKVFFDKAPNDFLYTNVGKLSREQMAGLLSTADIFVDYSTFQAMGLTAMEAMACGCAVIVPKNGGTGDFVKEGLNALVIDSSNKDECKGALQMLIDNIELREKLAHQALKDMCEYYPEKCAYKFLEAMFEEKVPGEEQR